MSQVRSYAGASYPERPVAFSPPPMAGEGPGVEAWLDVIEVLWQARTPKGLVFDVLAADGRRYRLEWEEAEDRWDVILCLPR
jgi:hypothetical protein